MSQALVVPVWQSLVKLVSMSFSIFAWEMFLRLYAEGKPAMKSPAIKGKNADEIQKQISTSPKHASLKNLTPAEVKDIAAYLATLK
jgi:hypothetical protein